MKTESTLKRSQSHGWRMGLGNLLSRENNTWWKTSRWWVQILVWGLITNGVLVLLLFLRPFMTEVFSNVNPEDLADIPDGITAFFSLAGLALPIGVVILVQGSIITEKELGTAEWVLSKPVSRTAFYLSKLIAHGIGIFVTMVLVQSGLAFVFISLSRQTPVSLTGFMTGAALLAILLFFYLSLTLMLEVIANKRAMVLGISLGAALGGALLVNLFPVLAIVTPFAAPNLIALIAQGATQQAGFPVWIPFLGTFLMSLAFVIIAVMKFKQKPL